VESFVAAKLGAHGADGGGERRGASWLCGEDVTEGRDEDADGEEGDGLVGEGQRGLAFHAEPGVVDGVSRTRSGGWRRGGVPIEVGGRVEAPHVAAERSLAGDGAHEVAAGVAECIPVGDGLVQGEEGGACTRFGCPVAGEGDVQQVGASFPSIVAHPGEVFGEGECERVGDAGGCGLGGEKVVRLVIEL